jgi:hypothetical protein
LILFYFYLKTRLWVGNRTAVLAHYLGRRVGYRVLANLAPSSQTVEPLGQQKNDILGNVVIFFLSFLLNISPCTFADSPATVFGECFIGVCT